MTHNKETESYMTKRVMVLTKNIESDAEKAALSI